MAYEIDFIGVSADSCSKDADAICLRWKSGVDYYGNPKYKIGVIDGGFEAHGDAMVNHINQYYFNDKDNSIDPVEKIIDFIVVTHPDMDHTVGLKKIFENFTVLKVYMNRPWIYTNELFDKVDDGRITKKSLYDRLRRKYATIADIEELAEDQGTKIIEAFQGTIIENSIRILSPSKSFYLQLLVESEKTPLTNHTADNLFGESIAKMAQRAKEVVLSLWESWTKELLREDVETSAENETSVVLRGLINEKGFLLTGDAGVRALNNAIDYLEQIGENVRETISFYQIPHHGGRHNINPSTLNRLIGNKVNKGETIHKTAFASVAKDSDHPKKMVTNAFIRRGVMVYKTDGATLWHHIDMPLRNWGRATNIQFSDYVEEWDD